jgi:signal transduction histidine kinase
MAHETVDEGRIFLSTMPAGRRDRRLALAVALVSVAIFLATAPFAKKPLPEVPAFLPIYQSALVVNDLITAVLLFGQFGILRSRALLVLASGYLFSALMATAHALSFPGLFAPTGLLGAGSQTTGWLYFLWHGVFPLLVIAYASLKNEPRETGQPRGSAGITVLFSIGLVFAVVCGLTLLTTAGHAALPVIMQGSNDIPAQKVVSTSTWVFSLAALAVLWWRRPHSVLDLWLMVVMCVWIFDIALAAVLNHGRYDLGWYVGRIYGLLAASFVLIMLLLESGKLYAQLSDSFASECQQRQLVERTSTELMAVNKELEAFSYSVSHDLRAPLRYIGGFAEMLKDESSPVLNETAKRYLDIVCDSVKQMGTLIDDLLAFSKMGRVALRHEQVSMTELVREAVEEVKRDARNRKIDWEIELLPAVRGDRATLKQAWVNLLSNAVKYSRHRSVAKIQVGSKVNSGDVEFHVTDNGAGFDMRYADKLFGVFQRLHRQEDFEGTGVGLANVRRIVVRHGGRTWAEGKVDEGASFYFTLPNLQKDGS